MRTRIGWLRHGFALGVAGLLIVAVAACGNAGSETTEAADSTDTTEGQTTEAADSSDATEGEAAAEGGGKIGFAWTDPSIEVFKPLISGAREEAEELGYEVLESNNEGDPAKQLADIQAWIGQKVAGIAILPLDPAATTNAAKDAKKAGIPVIGYSDKIEGADGSTTFNHIQGGTELGEHAAAWINENLGGKAKVGLLTLDSMQVGRERIDTAWSIIQEETDSELVGKVEAVAAADGLDATQTLLQKDPEMNVLLCVADDGCLGASRAFKAAGVDPEGVYLAGWDGALGALEAVRDGGYIKADAALDLKEVGRSVVYVIDNIIKGKEPTDKLHDYIIVDKDSGSELDELISNYGG